MNAAVSYPLTTSEYFATASIDGTLRIWDVNNYAVVTKAVCQPTITGAPQCLHFTGEVLFSGWADGKGKRRPACVGDDAIAWRYSTSDRCM